MNYPELAVLGVALAAVGTAVTYVLARRRTSAAERKHAPIAIAVTTLVLFVLTAIFDNFIIDAGIVAYDPTTLAGVMVGVAPIEDFSYPLAGAMLLPALWLALQRGGAQR